MTSSTLLILVLALALVAYYVGRQRAVSVAVVAGDSRSVHSLPGYHGGYVALWCALPALAALILWQVVEPLWLRSSVIGALPQDLRTLPADQLGLIYNDIRNLVAGNISSSEPGAAIMAAVARYTALRDLSHDLVSAAVLVIGVAGLAWAYRRVRADFRARNRVERAIEYLLIAASSVSRAACSTLF